MSTRPKNPIPHHRGTQQHISTNTSVHLLPLLAIDHLCTTWLSVHLLSTRTVVGTPDSYRRAVAGQQQRRSVGRSPNHYDPPPGGRGQMTSSMLQHVTPNCRVAAQPPWYDVIGVGRIPAPAGRVDWRYYAASLGERCFIPSGLIEGWVVIFCVGGRVICR